MKYSILFLLIFLCSNAWADDTKAILTVAYEASGESLAGQVAVASVIKTRMYIQGKTSEEIVLAYKQFSCWSTDGNPTQKRILTSKEIESARNAWKIATVGEFTNYYSGKRPYWFKNCKKIRRIGRHTFCRI